MGTYCSTSTCCANDATEDQTMLNSQGAHLARPPTFSSADLLSYQVQDEQEVRKLESMLHAKVSPDLLTNELCSHASVPKIFELLRKTPKDQNDYDTLLVRDSSLTIKQLEFGSLKYCGQTRVFRQNKAATQGKQGGMDQGEVLKCGYGRLEWPDRSSFEGFWLNGQTIGLGVFQTPDHDIYEGMWQQDKSTGLSVFRQSESPERQSGRGIEVWSDGSYYFGTFMDGVKQGFGVYYWADGSRYAGDWVADEMSGRGTFEWADGRNFEGEFKSGVMHGFGVYTWQDGRKYEGFYSLNKKHGKGIYTYSDGSKYNGEWVDGLQHGVGTIVDADSTYERKGVWANGKLKQWLKMD